MTKVKMEPEWPNHTDLNIMAQERDYWFEEAKKLKKQNAEYIEALRAAYPVLIEAVEKWSNGEDCYQSALDKVQIFFAPK